MYKWKNMLILILAACIIAAGAALPGLVSTFQDDASFGQIYYETVPNIMLQIRGEEAASPLKKLAMMTRMDGGLELSESMASMNSAEAEDRFYQIMQSYIDYGLITPFDPVVYESRCMLVSVTSDPSLNGIVWMATLISGDDQNFAQFDAAIDDETGDLLAVSYTGDRVLSEGERELYLSVFPNLYFTSLGIDDYVYYVTPDMNDACVGEHGLAVRYRFEDAVCGEVKVDFYVDQYGFYNQFPESGGGSR